MKYDLDQLNETFAAHESLAPDAEAVLAKSHEIARSLKRRQWAVRTTGGLALGAAAVVGGVVVPNALHGSSRGAVVIQPADSSNGPTSPPAAAVASDPLTAFFDAGYTYEDAQQLAQLWHDSGPDAVGNAKSEAGAKLIKGQTLPIPPSGTPASPDEIAMQTFWNAGYDDADAQQLAQIWHESDLSKVKVEAGQKLEAGDKLPVAPSGADAVKLSSVPTKESGEVNAFFAAGYTYDDAVHLAQTWNTASAYQAKVEGGQKIEAGDTLPIPPSGTPAQESGQQKALDAYFAAGYDYNDAVRLGQIWHESNTDQVKAEAGKKLENGETLPVSP